MTTTTFLWIFVLGGIFMAVPWLLWKLLKPRSVAARKVLADTASLPMVLAIFPGTMLATLVVGPELWRPIHGQVAEHRTGISGKQKPICNVVVQEEGRSPLIINVGCDRRAFCQVGVIYQRDAWNDSFQCGQQQLPAFPWSVTLSLVSLGLWMAGTVRVLLHTRLVVKD